MKRLTIAEVNARITACSDAAEAIRNPYVMALLIRERDHWREHLKDAAPADTRTGDLFEIFNTTGDSPCATSSA